MEFLLLGPIQVNAAGRSVNVGVRAGRFVLGVLAAEANKIVPATRLVELTWPESPPPKALPAIHTHIHRIRSSLARAGAADLGVAVLREGPGYLLRCDPERIDAHRFRLLTARARASSDDEQKVALLTEAAGLWRGPAMAGACDERTRARLCHGLEEARLLALEDRFDAELRIGRHRTLIEELTTLTAEHPYRQRLGGQLMLALYRAGRAPEALGAYRSIKQRLADELGMDPDGELQRLELAILRNDLRSAPASQPPANQSPARRPPAHLPLDIADFTARAPQVSEISRLLGGQDSVAVVAVTGPGGVGKSTLAIHVAHQLSAQFPDGQLYADLRAATARPLPAARALAGFLLALGMDAPTLPAGLQERANLYRSRLAGRRMLVLLDDAASEAQVRPLLPGTAGCAVLVTSRTRLAGLEAARHVGLAGFEPAQAVELLGRIAGQSRIAAEPPAAAGIVRMCGYLPLAVRIAAARLAGRPDLTLARLNARLRDERTRLDELAAGDLAVRSVAASSYRSLDGAARRALRLTALLDAPHFASWAAAALLDAPQQAAERVLDSLVDAHLLEVTGTDETGQARYRMHDLIRDFARERARIEDSAAVRRAALLRGIGGWLAMAEAAADKLGYTYLAPVRGTAPRPPVGEDLAAAVTADPVAWFTAERAGLRAATTQATRLGFASLAWETTWAPANFRSSYEYCEDDWAELHAQALRACRATGDRTGEAVMLRGLADAAIGRRAQYAEGLEHAKAAQAIFDELGITAGVADCMALAAHAHRCLGDHGQAARLASSAAALARRHRIRSSEAFAVELLGVVRREQGRLETAARHAQRLIDLTPGPDAHLHQATAWRLLGDIRGEQRRYAEGSQALTRALAAARRARCRPVESLALISLARLQAAQGHPDALGTARQALALAEDIGHRFSTAEALRIIGLAARATGEHDAAIASLRRAAAICQEISLPFPRARALDELAQAAWHAGDRGTAAQSWGEARDLLAMIGNSRAADGIAARLSGIASSQVAP